MKNSSPPSVLWPQVIGLGLVQSAMTLTWIIYNLYLKKLLVDFGFSAELATTVLVVENVLAIALEPLMGSFSDRARIWVGTRFPFIAGGTILAALCFLAIPTVVFLGNSTPQIRLVLPATMVAWAVAMTVFRSPALSLLGKYAAVGDLPKAAAVLTLFGALTSILRPLAKEFILNLGALAAFAIGSAVLLIAVGYLRWLDSRHPLETQEERTSRWQDLSWVGLGLIVGCGVGMTLGFRVMLANFSKIVATQTIDANLNLIIGTMFLVLALTAMPAGIVAKRIGYKFGLMGGLVALAILLAIAPGVNSSIAAMGLAIALGAAYSFAANGTIPFALSLVPSDKGGFGIGLYFGGSALALSLFNTTLKDSELLVGIVAFLAASLCAAASRTLQKAQ